MLAAKHIGIPIPMPTMTDPSLSVLLVEDDEVVRTSLRFALESVRLHISEAGSVDEGRRCFSAKPSDVVVIDLHLPDGSGYDLALWLRQVQAHVPLVMISTDPGDDVRTLPLDGRSITLAKPFSASQLLDAISRVASGSLHA